jgi:hypothetical protein
MNTEATLTVSEEQAEAILRQRLCGRVRELRVRVSAEGVVLQGASANFYGKQMAQHLAHKLLGLTILANEIEVRSLAPGVPPTSPQRQQGPTLAGAAGW